MFGKPPKPNLRTMDLKRLLALARNPMRPKLAKAAIAELKRRRAAKGGKRPPLPPRRRQGSSQQQAPESYSEGGDEELSGLPDLPTAPFGWKALLLAFGVGMFAGRLK